MFQIILLLPSGAVTVTEHDLWLYHALCLGIWLKRFDLVTRGASMEEENMSLWFDQKGN